MLANRHCPQELWGTLQLKKPPLLTPKMSILPSFATIPSSSSQSSLLLHSDMLHCINSSMLQLCFSSQKHNDNIGIDRVAILCVPKKLCSHLVAVPGHCCKTRHEIQESLGSWHWRFFSPFFCWAFIWNAWLLHHMTLCRRICCFVLIWSLNVLIELDMQQPSTRKITPSIFWVCYITTAGFFEVR